jgi:branched-chain amino acid transport system ATP-binding protein
MFRQVSVPARLLAFGTMGKLRTEAAERVADVLRFIDMAAHAETAAGDLPYGLQKMLGVGMAVAARPQMMLMDEPAAGLNPVETIEMGRLIGRLRTELGITVVLVEHDMKMVMGLCDRILVLNYGQVMKIGTAEEVRSDPAVIEAYLGAENASA